MSQAADHDRRLDGHRQGEIAELLKKLDLRDVIHIGPFERRGEMACYFRPYVSQRPLPRPHVKWERRKFTEELWAMEHGNARP